MWATGYGCLFGRYWKSGVLTRPERLHSLELLTTDGPADMAKTYLRAYFLLGRHIPGGQ